jgi:hypothetical protein
MSTPEIYNTKRRIIFCTYHKEGFDKALQFLESYRPVLGTTGYVGLRAELAFYNNFGREFSLTVAGDMGEHADFAGMMGRMPVRFDVTTNKDYKKLKHYEKFLCEGYEYKIAIFDQVNWEIIDVLELAFPRCPVCGDSCMFPLAILQPMNYNRHGDPLWHNDQEIVELCPCCHEVHFKTLICNSHVRSYSELCQEQVELNDDFPATPSLDNELRASVKFLEKSSGFQLVGLAEHAIRQEHKYDEEERGLFFPYLSDVVQRRFPSFCPI